MSVSMQPGRELRRDSVTGMDPKEAPCVNNSICSLFVLRGLRCLLDLTTM